ncbi:fibronectin type III domain-containing protein [Allomuricauda sp. SCSIO 65647]|uniref:fibronectin type III domain-containing protein n=1 Tax=Allomuricauda sp. SCSIO 65647 TaxID=2908843 RepID=UPI001F365CD2|nr:fibronectin type III domain-containing protein [Muricauda sp. SCSIO 65647]UJH66241.1 fibronectin type III domain-containing protein [Muricauda sp. SCSIO 65647]
MNAAKYIPAILVMSLLSACGGGGDDGQNNPEPDPIPAPSATTLIFPENNSECTEGTVLSDAESEVTFRWNSSENTDSYTIKLRDLDTDTSQELQAQSNELQIRLNRGTPYSWSVVSKANGTTETAESASWKFYNAGPGIENYSPFPADNPTPKIGASVTAGTITLTWEGNDLDGDIISYEVYLQTSNPPETSIGDTTESTIDIEVNSNTVYYWRVITTDAMGNSSRSAVFQFRVN